MERKPSIDGMSNWLSGSEVQAGRLEEAQKAQQEDGPAPVFLPKAVREAPQLGRPTQWQWIAYHSQMLGSWSTKSTTEVQTVSAKPCSSAAEGSESARASYLLTAWRIPYPVWSPCLFPFSLLCTGMEEHKKSNKRRETGGLHVTIHTNTILEAEADGIRKKTRVRPTEAESMSSCP